MKPAVDLAYLLRSVKYRDSDLVVTILTRSHGPVALLARGARKSKKRFGGALDYGRLFSAEFTLPKESGLGTLSSVALKEDFPAAVATLEGHAAVGHALEVLRLLAREGDQSPEPFSLLDAFLRALQKGADPLSLARVFQIKAAALAGYSLADPFCASCGEKLEEKAFFEGGKLHCGQCRPPSAATLCAGALKTVAAAASLAPASLGSLKISRVIDSELGPFIEERLTRALGGEPKSLAALRALLAD